MARPEKQIETQYISKGDDYEFYITPSYSITNRAYLSSIKNSTTGAVAGTWAITKDAVNNRIYFKLTDAQTSNWAAGQYEFDIKETDSSVNPPFDNHILWGYIQLEASIT